MTDATARALARGSASDCWSLASGGAATASAPLEGVEVGAAAAGSSSDTGASADARLLATAAAAMPLASNAVQHKEDLARGIFRGLMPTRPTARHVLGQVEIALHELRAIALDTPRLVKLIGKHHQSKKDHADAAVPLVVWADVSFETQHARTAHRRVDLAVVSFDRPRAIGETREQRTVSAKREVVTRVAWGPDEGGGGGGEDESKRDDGSDGDVVGTIGKRCGRNAFIATFDVTDITADIRVVFHARRFEVR